MTAASAIPVMVAIFLSIAVFMVTIALAASIAIFPVAAPGAVATAGFLAARRSLSGSFSLAGSCPLLAPGSVGLGLDAMEGVLKRADQDLAPLVVGNLGLLDEGYCCDQSLNGTGVIGSAGVCHCPCDRAAGDSAVATHDLFELGLADCRCCRLGSTIVDRSVLEVDRWGTVVDVTPAATLGCGYETGWNSLLVEEGRVQMGIGDGRWWNRRRDALSRGRNGWRGPVGRAHRLGWNSNMSWRWLVKMAFPIIGRWWASGIRWRDASWAHGWHGASGRGQSHIVGWRGSWPDRWGCLQSRGRWWSPSIDVRSPGPSGRRGHMVDLGRRGVDPRGTAWLVLRRRRALWGRAVHVGPGRDSLLLVVVLTPGVAVPAAPVVPPVLVHVPVVLPHVPAVAIAVSPVAIPAAALVRVLVTVRTTVAAFSGLHLEVV